jgi:hypothetical protein
MSKTLAPLIAALALAGCSSLPPLPPRQPDRSAAAAPPESAPQRNVTNFNDALRCMDNLYLAYGTRDVSVLLEDLTDATKKVSAGTRDMMMSAISDMTRRSRAIQVIAFGQDSNNIVAFLNNAQQRSAYAVVPQFNLRGSITQLDESVLRRQADAGVSLGNVLGAGASRSRQLNVLGLDLAMVNTANLSLVSGVVSKNLTTIIKEGDAFDSQATISKVGINFSTSFQRTDGTAQALRNMVELASVELFGRLLKLPYWSCIGAGVDNAEVKNEVEDWFIGMERSGELTPFFQMQLRNRGFYDGPVDGQVTPALRQAVAAYRRGTGLGNEPVVDLALFTRFIGAPFPPPPQQAFSDRAVTSATAALASPATSNTPAPAAITPPQLAPGPSSVTSLALTLSLGQSGFVPGEPVTLTVQPNLPAYVYCYSRDNTGVVQRIFPNRFAADPRVDPARPLALPGKQGFRLTAGKAQTLACLAARREIYNDVPAALRWGDFQALNAVRGFDEVRRMLEGVAKEPVALASIEVPLVAARR